MRTWEPTAIGRVTSTSAPDALMLSTSPRIILLLWSFSFPYDRLTGQRMGMRSEILPSPVAIRSVVATSSFCGPVQARLIEIGMRLLDAAFNAIQLSLEARLPLNRAKSRTITIKFSDEGFLSCPIMTPITTRVIKNTPSSNSFTSIRNRSAEPAPAPAPLDFTRPTASRRRGSHWARAVRLRPTRLL
jgi:hypothetical protein